MFQTFSSPLSSKYHDPLSNRYAISSVILPPVFLFFYNEKF
jgi:hypothetical protein